MEKDANNVVVDRLHSFITEVSLSKPASNEESNAHEGIPIKTQHVTLIPDGLVLVADTEAISSDHRLNHIDDPIDI